MALEPYMPTVVIGGGFLRHGGSAAQKAAHIPFIIDRSRVLRSRRSRRTRAMIFERPSLPPRRRTTDWIIDGDKFVVTNGDNADAFNRSHRASNAHSARNRSAVFLVPASAKSNPKRTIRSRCLVPSFDGAFLSHDSKDALWVKFYTAAPPRRRQSVEQYKIVKRA